MTIPNLISLFRIAAIPLLMYALFIPSEKNILAASIFIALILTDALDGYLARKLNAITTFGKYLDPLADKILIITALIGLVELNAVSSIPVMIIVVREFAVTGWRIMAAKQGAVIAASRSGKWKTIFQMLAVLMLILNLQYGNIILWIAVGLSVISGIDYIYKSWEKVIKENG